MSLAIFILLLLKSNTLIENKSGFWITFISIAFFSDKFSWSEISELSKKLTLFTLSNWSNCSLINATSLKLLKGNFLKELAGSSDTKLLKFEAYASSILKLVEFIRSGICLCRASGFCSWALISKVCKPESLSDFELFIST